MIRINIANKDIPDSERLTGKAHMVTLIKDQDVTLNVDQNTKFTRIEEAYWQMLPYCKSFRVTSENLGMAFMFEVAK